MPRSPAAGGIVILHAGWSGENVLVRLLSAAGTIDILGHVLGRPVARPARHLRRALRARDGRVAGAFVQPHHLWLIQGVDPEDFVDDLIADGVVIVSLHRSSGIDRGVSRALCGADHEVLPTGQRLLDPAAVAVFASENDLAAAWFAEVVPAAQQRLVFETDLLTVTGRESTVATVAGALGLDSWVAPPERELPSSDVLWGHVANGDEVSHTVAPITRRRDG